MKFSRKIRITEEFEIPVIFPWYLYSTEHDEHIKIIGYYESIFIKKNDARTIVGHAYTATSEFNNEKTTELYSNVFIENKDIPQWKLKNDFEKVLSKFQEKLEQK